MQLALLLVAAYLLGSVPFAVVVSRLFGMADPRSYGSGNPGATNVLRSGNKLAAVLTLVGDAFKGWLAVFAAASLAPAMEISAIAAPAAGLAAFLGHLFPIFLGFKGGKGVATSAGLLIGLAPMAVLIGLALWIVSFVLSRYVSVASILAALAIAVVGWPLYLASRGPFLPAVLTLLAALTIWRHRSNIQRLRNGTENRFNFKKRPAS